MANVLVICGSLRKASFNAIVAKSLPALAPAGLNLITSPPIGDIALYKADVQEKGFPASVTALGDAVRKADGVIIVTPEYNYSIPGVLKNAIDWVSRLPDQPFAHKPVALQSASQGQHGGARAQYHLRQTLVFLEAHVFNRPEIFVATAQNKVNDKGELTDQTTRDFIKQQLEGFAKFIVRVSGK
jgi:chromate reductase